MQRRYNLAHFILANIVALGLSLLIVEVEVQARIAFVSQRDGNPEIYMMTADGKNQRRLTKNHHGDSSPSWSPDGKRIAFTSDRDWLLDKDGWPTNEIYVMDADGQNRRRLTENRQNDWYPSWSPDGERIAFASQRAGNVEIYVMDADGQNRRRLTNNRHDDTHPAWFNPTFAVAPAGKKLTIWGWLKQVVR